MLGRSVATRQSFRGSATARQAARRPDEACRVLARGRERAALLDPATVSHRGRALCDGLRRPSRVWSESRVPPPGGALPRVLDRTRCPGSDVTAGATRSTGDATGTIERGTPLITTLAYVYEARRDVHAVDGRSDGAGDAMIAQHHVDRITATSRPSPRAASCTYTPSPQDGGGVVNASA